MLMLALSWAGSGWGLVTNLNVGQEVPEIWAEDRPFTLAGVAILLLFALVLRSAGRAQKHDARDERSALAPV